MILERLAASLADRYRIEREIGQGGMATVYLAHDLRHNRKVAVKVLAAELAAMIGAERFLKEIEVTANLQHPHILPLFDSGIAQAGEGEGSRFLYYVMPFVQGDTLRDKLQREKELSVKEAVELTRSVAAALDYAHRHGVIHRDIKPENVLLHDGQAMVADFGIALAIREAGGTRLTGTGLSVGTPSYMSPEQAMGDREITARSDIYSLGAMLYEMLTGSPPFTGNSAQAIVAKILTETAPLVTKARSSVPDHVAAAIHRALERLPADRFATAAEFAEALGNTAFTVQGMTGTSVGRGASRSPWNPLTLAMASVALVATLAAAWFATRPAPEAPVRRLSLAFARSNPLSPLGINRLALAPDGSGFVYAGVDETGRPMLLLRPFGQLEATALPGTEGGMSPSFSPDGSRIAFLGTGPFTVRVVAINGAPAVTLADSAVIGGGVAWSKDDWVYFDAGNSLDRVRGDGSDREVVVALDVANGEVGFAWPEPLPNGKGLVYRSRRAGESTRSYLLKVIDLVTRESRVLVPGLVARYTPTGHLVYVSADGVMLAAPFDQDRMEFTGSPTPIVEGLGVAGFGGVDLALAPTGDLLYVSSTVQGGQRPSWVRRDGSATLVDPGWDIPPETIQDWALSPDGKRLALTIGSNIAGPGGASDIWVKDLDDGPVSKLTFTRVNRQAAWTADGQSIVYASAPPDDPNLRFQLFRLRADGTGSPEPLLTDPRGVASAAVSSRDGWVVVGTMGISGGGGDLLAFQPGIDTAMIPLLEGPAYEGMPALSPDGRWLAYASEESGRIEVYIRPFPDVNRGEWQVSLDGGYNPRWSRTGKELFFLNLSNGFMAVEIRTDPALSIGRRQLLHAIGVMPLYEVGLDDQRFLRLWSAARSDSTATELVLIQNFLGTLRARQ
ncbi:MAG: protein kinase [Gemmatimonadales bacterium]